MNNYLKNEKGFLTLVGILISLGLLFFFVYYIINIYFGPQNSKQGVSSPSGSNSVANYQSIIGSTKEKVQEMNQKTIDQLKQVEESLKK